MKNNNHQRKERGVSLLETMIYIGIFAIVSVGIVGIFWNVLKTTTNQGAVNEVDENLRQAIAIIGDKVHGAAIIQTATGTDLILRMPEERVGDGTSTADDFSTTTFSIVDDMLYLTEDGGSPVAVLSNKVKVDILNFRKIDKAGGTKAGVRVNMAISYNSTNPNLSFSKSLLSTVNRATAVTFNEDILPGDSNTHYIGSDALRWRDGFFSGNVDVSGNVDAVQLCIASDCKTSWADVGQWISTTTGIYYNLGDVGIGTSTPEFDLHVKRTGGPALFVAERTDNAVQVQISAGNTEGYMGTRSDHPLYLIQNSDTMMTFSTDGKIGMGTTTPTAVLHIVRDGATNLYLERVGNAVASLSAGITSGYFGTRTEHPLEIHTGSSISTRIFIDDDAGGGEVGINDTTPSEQLDVDGNIGLTGTLIPDNACGIAGTILSFRDSGALSATGSLLDVGGQGDVLICPGTVLAISAQCQTADVSNYAAFEVRKNGSAQVCDTSSITSPNNGYSTTGCNISLITNDIIGCYVKSKTGAPDTCRCGIYIRFD